MLQKYLKNWRALLWRKKTGVTSKMAWNLAVNTGVIFWRLQKLISWKISHIFLPIRDWYCVHFLLKTLNCEFNHFFFFRFCLNSATDSLNSTPMHILMHGQNTQHNYKIFYGSNMPRWTFTHSGLKKFKISSFWSNFFPLNLEEKLLLAARRFKKLLKNWSFSDR